MKENKEMEKRTWMAFLTAIFIAAAPTCFAQTGAFVYSVVNSASNREGPIAQGSIFTVRGFSLGPNQPVEAKPDSPPLELGGTSIKVVVGGNTFNCPMISASFDRATAILPSNTP